MKGIYLINDRLTLNGFSQEESISLQKEAILNYISQKNIEILTLNPYQLNDYYTNFHALLYDLKMKQKQWDCFLYYSDHVVEDFIYTYPAKWVILKSFFNEVIAVENQNDLNIQRVI